MLIRAIRILSVGANQTTGFIGDVVAHQKPPAYTFKENMSFPSWSEDESPTLQAENYHAVAYPIDTQNMTENHSSGGKGFGQEDDPSFTLTKGHSHAVASIRENQRSEVTEHEISDALLSGGGKPGSGYAAIREGMAVRRLTPTECERLQGFPDGYTDIPGASDSGRYKALGNSMAVPVMNWIGMRINNAKAALSRNDKKNS
jgi:DNA (cytosine-5)-methyltransferase 1